MCRSKLTTYSNIAPKCRSKACYDKTNIIESLLISCVLFQSISGCILIYKRKGLRHTFLEKAQVWSGLYLAFFLINHLFAVFAGRLILDLDTNVYFAISGFYVFPFSLFFVPYYFLAVSSIFVHLACAFN